MSKETISRVEKLYRSFMGIKEDHNPDKLIAITALELQSLSEEEAKTASAVFAEIERHMSKMHELLGEKVMEG